MGIIYGCEKGGGKERRAGGKGRGGV